MSPEVPDSGDHDEVLERFAASVARLDDAATAREREELSEVLLQRAFTLQTAGRVDDAVVAYSELADRFSGASEDAIRRDVVSALQQRGHLLRALGRDVEAQASLNQAVAVGGQLARPTVAQIRAGVGRATELERDERYGEAIEALADIIRPWGHAPPDDAAELVAFASVLSARAAVRVGPNVEAALQTCDEVVEHYGGSADPGVRAMVVWGLTTKGYVYACAKRYDEAEASCARAVEYAGDDDDPRIRACVTSAIEQMERWRTASSEDGATGTSTDSTD
jgi:tetratricopeptide (TPR) repeat protein